MWKKIGYWPVGGLREIGFKPNTEILMVLSSQGRGIFDCSNNLKIGRDYSDYYCDKWDCEDGIVEGFGILENEKIKCGGFEHPDILKKETIDHWIAKMSNEIRKNHLQEDKEAEVLYLENKLSSQIIEIDFFHNEYYRAYGFSDSGKSFVISTSSDIEIWTKE